MKSRNQRLHITSTSIAIGLLLLALPTGINAQETAPEETAPAPKGEPATAADAQAYLGYWMLTAKLGQQDTKMGLVLHTDREGGDATQLAGSLASTFGEMEAGNFRKLDKSLGFDLESGLGKFQVEITVNDDQITGKFGDEGGTLSADFTGTKSDRIAFQRFMVPDDETRVAKGEQMVRLRFARPKAGERDFGQLETLEPGGVVEFLEFGAIKLMTDFDLEFGSLAVNTENVTENYPGVYSLWLKRTTDGWSLVFNHKPDVWGTQYDPSADLGEVPLAMEAASEESERLVAKFEEANGAGTLRLTWGPHSWTTPFKIKMDEDAAN